jgi:hypothetical protein
LEAAEQEPERGLLRRPQRSLLQGREQTRVRGLLRLKERHTQRGLGRVRFQTRLHGPEQTLVQVDERVEVRGLVLGMERGKEPAPEPDLERSEDRLLLPALETDLLNARHQVRTQDIGNRLLSGHR